MLGTVGVRMGVGIRRGMMWRGGSEDIGIYLQEKNMGMLDATGSQRFDMVLYANTQACEKNFHESCQQIRIP